LDVVSRATSAVLEDSCADMTAFSVVSVFSRVCACDRAVERTLLRSGAAYVPKLSQGAGLLVRLLRSIELHIKVVVLGCVRHNSGSVLLPCIRQLLCQPTHTKSRGRTTAASSAFAWRAR
jgi:hypothetical protein